MLRIIQWFTIFYVILLTLLLELPSSISEEVPVEMAGVYAYVHAIAFFLLGLLVELSREKRSIFFWLGILIVYAIATEVLQGLLHAICNRFFDWTDVLQNVIGVLTGTFIGHFCRPLVRRTTG